MKKLVLGLIILLAFTACNNNNSKAAEEIKNDSTNVNVNEAKPEPGLLGLWKGKVDFTGGYTQYIQLHLYSDSTYVRTQMNSSTGSKKFYEIGCWKVISDTLLMLDGSGLNTQYMAIKQSNQLSYRDPQELIPSNLTSEFFEKGIEQEEELPGDYKFEGMISYDKKNAKFLFCIAQRRLEIAKTNNYQFLIDFLKSHGIKEGQATWVQVTGHLDNRVAETETAAASKFYAVKILKVDSTKTCQ